MVNSFTFYQDYYNLVDTLSNKDKKEMLVAIVDYVFKNEIPNLKGHNQAIFNTLKHQLDLSKNNSKRAKKDKPEEKPKGMPKENKTSILSFKFYILSFKFNNNINKLLEEYLELRIKNKYSITETIVNRLCNKLKEYTTTDEEKEEIILNAINGSWKDFYPLHKKKENKVPEWFDMEFKEEEMSEEAKKIYERIK